MDSSSLAALSHTIAVLHQQPTQAETLDALTHTVREAMPHFEHVGVSLTSRDGRIVTVSTSDPMITGLEDLQYETQEGPCYDCVTGQDVVVAAPLGEDRRYPRYAARAHRTGIRAQLALRLYLDDHGAVGGLNFYSTSVEAVTDDDLTLASLFAGHAAAALGKTREVTSLAGAIEHREVVGQALGLLMARFGVDAVAARRYLWRASSHGNVKVRDLARQTVEEHERRTRPR